eukprot:jgi/Psemu1/55678/gm1.55678_g
MVRASKKRINSKEETAKNTDTVPLKTVRGGDSVDKVGTLSCGTIHSMETETMKLLKTHKDTIEGQVRAYVKKEWYAADSEMAKVLASSPGTVALNTDSMEILAKEYRRDGNAANEEFYYFTNFKLRKTKDRISTIFTVTDEAFALMIIDNEYSNWEKQKQMKLDGTYTTQKKNKIHEKKHWDSKSGSANGWDKEGRKVFTKLCKKIQTLRENPERKIEDVRKRLNSKKGHFDEDEALKIWEQCFKYVSKEVVPDYEEGNTDGIDHVWARMERYGRTFSAKEWCNLTPEAREHRKQCIYYNPVNRPCMTSIWYNNWCKKTNEVIIENDRLQWYCNSTDNNGLNSTYERFPTIKVKKINNKDTETKRMEQQWDSFMNKARKQSKRKTKSKRINQQGGKKEEDEKERKIEQWLHLYRKRWNSPEDLEECNNCPVPCGAWGHVKH